MGNIDRSTLIRNRFIECLNNGELFSCDELKIIEVLFERAKLMTIQDYANSVNKSYNGVQDMIARDKLSTIKISDKRFVIANLN